MDARPLSPSWTNATFLQYVGTIIALGSLLALFEVLQEAHGTAGLLGWSLLAVAIAVGLVVVAQQRGEPVVAGLVAVVAVICWAVLVGSVLDLLGFDFLARPQDDAGFFTSGVGLDTIALEALVIAGAAVALRRTGFPFLVLIVAAVVWYSGMDLLEGLFRGGDTATAILALIAGLVFVAVGAAKDGGGAHPYAFWLHVVGGVSVGGAILWFWHEETWQWLLVLVVSLGYVAASRSLRRSSYAVLGALGLAGTATYFIEKWFSLGSLVPFFRAEPESVDRWGRPLVYLALGGVLLALGILVGAGRGRGTTPAASPPGPIADPPAPVAVEPMP